MANGYDSEWLIVAIVALSIAILILLHDYWQIQLIVNPNWFELACDLPSNMGVINGEDLPFWWMIVNQLVVANNQRSKLWAVDY